MKTVKGQLARVRSLLKLMGVTEPPREGRTKDCARRYAYLEQAGMARAAQRL